MALKQFDVQQYGYSADTNELVRMGRFQVPNSGPLKYIKCQFYLLGVGSLGGSETMSLSVYSDNTYQNILHTSGTLNFSDIDFDGASNFLFWQRFDFDEYNLNSNITYFLGLQLNNYTPVEATFEFFAMYDFPDSINENFGSSPNFSQRGMRFVMYQKLDRFS